jgi:hypothetical protein
VPNKYISVNLTEGLGAGANPVDNNLLLKVLMKSKDVRYQHKDYYYCWYGWITGTGAAPVNRLNWQKKEIFLQLVS